MTLFRLQVALLPPSCQAWVEQRPSFAPRHTFALGAGSAIYRIQWGGRSSVQS